MYLEPEKFLEQLAKYFDPKRALNNFLEVQESSIRLHGKENIYEWTYNPKRVGPDIYPPTVIIDPGHIGGEFCDLRKIPANGAGFMQEGNITLVTSLLVKRLLEDKGIKVILTRKSYAPVTKRSISEFEKEATESLSIVGRVDLPPFLRSQFPKDIDYMKAWMWNREDLYERARFINSNPRTLSLSIHYLGALGSEYTNSNGMCVFVKGNYLPEELLAESHQVKCLDQIAEGNFDETISLGKRIFKRMKERLYLSEPENEFVPNSLKVDEGVYCRNLVLSRMAEGIFVYIEGPFQNNKEEIKRLLSVDGEISGYKYSDRILQYAKSIAEGIDAHLKKK